MLLIFEQINRMQHTSMLLIAHHKLNIHDSDQYRALTMLALDLMTQEQNQD